MKTFGHRRPIRNVTGDIDGMKDSPARAITKNELGGAFGCDRDRKLVVSLEEGDLICIRPSGTRRTYRAEARGVFRWLLQCEANRINLERARDRKAKKSARLAAARVQRTEKRLFNK